MEATKFNDLLRVARAVKKRIPNKIVRRIALADWLYNGKDWRIYA